MLSGLRFGLLFLLSGCFSGAYLHPSTGRPSQWRNIVPQGAVRQVAQAGEDLWLATSHGALRVSLDGGRPLLLTAAEGLCHNDVRAVAVAPDGTVWFGTAAGACAFQDGRFQPLSEEAAHGVSSLAVDGHGQIWAGLDGPPLPRPQPRCEECVGERGALLRGGALVLRQGRWEALEVAGKPLRGGVRAMARGGQGDIYLSAPMGRVVHVGGPGGMEVLVPHGQAKVGEILAMTVDPFGRLWVGAQGGLFMAKDGHLALAPGGELFQGERKIRGLAYGPEGLWIARGSRLMLHDGEGWSALDPEGLALTFTTVAVTDQGTMVAGTDQGAFLVGPQGLAPLEGHEPGAPGLAITALLRTEEGVLVGHGPPGLQAMPLVGPLAIIQEEIGQEVAAAWNSWAASPQGPPGKAPASRGAEIPIKAKKIKVLAQRTGSPSPLERLRGRRISPLEAKDFSAIHCLAEVDGRVWMGTDKGVRVLGEGGVEPGPKALEGRAVRALIQNSKGTIIVAVEDGQTGAGQGLRLHKAQGWSELTSAQGLPSNRVLSLALDHDQQIWVGTMSGLCRLQEDKCAIVRDKGIAPGVPVLALAAQTDGLYAGTCDGLLRHDGERFLPVGPIGPVLSLASDGGGLLFAGREEGVLQVQGRSVRLLGPPQGAIAGPIGALAYHDGLLIAGSLTGEIALWETGAEVEDGK